MSVRIVLLMKLKCAPPKSQKWREYVSIVWLLMKWKHGLPDSQNISHECPAHEMDIRTH